MAQSNEARSELDTAAVTGESLPQSAKIGDPVLAGALNLSAPIQIRTWCCWRR